MALHYIRVEHDVVEYAILEIEADSPQEALEKARTEPNHEMDAQWELTNWVGDSTYYMLDDDYNIIDEE